MVTVIKTLGFNVAAQTALDLSPFVEDDIAILLGVRTLTFRETVYATMSVVMSHTHSLDALAAHTHNLENEGTHLHDAGASTEGDVAGGANHSHTGFVNTPAAGAFSPTVDAQGAYAPTTAAYASWNFSAIAISAITGPVLTNQWVNNNGYVDATYITPAAGSVGLTGRQQIHLGQALSVGDYMEIRVLHFKEVAGIF